MRECVPVAMALCRSRASAVRVSCMCRMTVQNRFKKRKFLPEFYLHPVDINTRQRRLLCKAKHKCFKAYNILDLILGG